jgi:hypothetical protein
LDLIRYQQSSHCLDFSYSELADTFDVWRHSLILHPLWVHRPVAAWRHTSFWEAFQAYRSGGELSSDLEEKCANS